MWELSPNVGIFTLHQHFHLTWAFSPQLNILTSHGHSKLHGHFHLMWAFIPCLDTLTSCGHFYLMWVFSLHVDILTLHIQITFEGMVGCSCTIRKVTLCRDSHLLWTFSPFMGTFHLTCTSSPHMGIFTSCGNSHLALAFSLHVHTNMFPTKREYFFTLHGKIPKIVMKQPQLYQ